MSDNAHFPFVIESESLLGDLKIDPSEAPISGATWYTGDNVGDGILYRFPTGALEGANYLTADILADGNHLPVFMLTLREGEDGPVFRLSHAVLNQCSARMRMPLEAVNQSRWRYDREGAWLKPYCGGDRVDLSKVDRMTITVLRKSDLPVRWCMTHITATVEAPPRLTELVLPKGKLMDGLGQSALHEWPTKSRSADEVTERLCTQFARAPEQRWPEDFPRWGGWTGKRLEATGFFRTHHDGERWWLVDPDGCIFWSAGMDCVRVDTTAAYGGLEQALTWLPDPEGDYEAIYGGRGGQPMINYLAANFIRAFGTDDWYDKWAEIALAELRRFGFNTVANWSDWKIAKQAGFPYVRPLSLTFPKTPRIFRDFPDVFHPGFAQDVEAFAEQLRDTADDPAFIGYFLMNEPTWGFAGETPAAGMLFTTQSCASRKVLSGVLQERYGDDSSLSAAWEMDVTLDDVAEGKWRTPLTDAAKEDLAEFSSVMVEMLFRGLSDACRKVDPNHLNLGARYYTIPPSWAISGMRCFDVYSMNCYRERIPAVQFEQISRMLDQPIMVGEWHFGALDVGLPGSGIGHVRNQADRGKAYRVYTEDAASKRYCIGVHYFTLYDESAIGRFDGENWNIGFLDVCNRPYQPLAEAARATHERLYQVAVGEIEPYSDEPEYLPKLFL
jgi:hypothetical protein